MRITSLAALVLLAAGLSEPAAAAEFTRIASHLLAPQANASCYLSNPGKSAIRVKDLKLLAPDGGVLAPQVNTCGTKAFSLAPGATCFIGVHNPATPLACSALVSDPETARGSLESRVAQYSQVLARARMTAGSGGSSATEFEAFASPSAFNHYAPHSIICRITNVGETSVKLKGRKITTSAGAALPVWSDTCGTKAEATLKPEKSCMFVATSDQTQQDNQCRVMATRKVNLRGSLSHHDGFPAAEME